MKNNFSHHLNCRLFPQLSTDVLVKKHPLSQLTACCYTSYNVRTLDFPAQGCKEGKIVLLLFTLFIIMTINMELSMKIGAYLKRFVSRFSASMRTCRRAFDVYLPLPSLKSAASAKHLILLNQESRCLDQQSVSEGTAKSTLTQ